MSGSRKESSTASISVEGRYLLLLLSSLSRSEAPPPAPNALDWTALDRLARAQALVAVCRRQIPPESLPAKIRAGWDRICQENFLDNSMALAGARRILSVLEEADIPAAVLRGIRLAYGIYPDALLRPMRDVDILIPEDAGDQADARLIRAGLPRATRLRSQLVVRLSGKDFEIHLSYVTPKRYRRIAGYANWLDDTVEVATPQGSVRCLSLENELIGLMLHAFVHHDLERLSQMLDVALVMTREGIDWEYIRRWAAHARLSKVMVFVLAYAQWLFDLPEGGWSAWCCDFLPGDREALFASYAALILGDNRRRHYLIHRRHMLDVAETLPRKVRQILKFLQPPEWVTFFNLMRREGNDKHRKGAS